MLEQHRHESVEYVTYNNQYKQLASFAGAPNGTWCIHATDTSTGAPIASLLDSKLPRKRSLIKFRYPRKMSTRFVTSQPRRTCPRTAMQNEKGMSVGHDPATGENNAAALAQTSEFCTVFVGLPLFSH